jgi:transposase InsO family protein
MGEEGTESRQSSDSASAARRRDKTPAIAGGPAHSFTPGQRMLILDIWDRSELSAREIAPLVGLCAHTLYDWKKRFDQNGPAGLADRPRGKPALGSRLPEPTQRAIQLLKRKHPDWGVDRIQDVLMRGEGFTASTGAIQRVLVEAGYQVETAPTRRHPEPRVQSFERARPNQLWQSDLFTFTLKRENRRLYMVVFLDDHSRFVVGQGVHASSRGAMVQEALEAAIANFGPPEEVLTDNGPQYHSWRGKSAFTKVLERRGIRHLVSRPRHPQTLGKTERFWGTLWRECMQEAVFQGVEDARQRIGHFIDHYNFQRPHQGIEGLVPADRYFSAESEVRKTLEERVAQNAVDLARHGEPRKAFYLTGRVGGEGISLHGEGGKVILTRNGGTREEVDLKATGKREHPDEKPPQEAESSGGES